MAILRTLATWPTAWGTREAVNLQLCGYKRVSRY